MLPNGMEVSNETVDMVERALKRGDSILFISRRMLLSSNFIKKEILPIILIWNPEYEMSGTHLIRKH